MQGFSGSLPGGNAHLVDSTPKVKSSRVAVAGTRGRRSSGISARLLNRGRLLESQAPANSLRLRH